MQRGRAGCRVRPAQSAISCFSESWTITRATAGLEVDLMLTRGRRRVAIEIKHTSTPRLQRGLVGSMRDVQATHGYLVAPIQESFELSGNVTALGVHEIARIEV